MADHPGLSPETVLRRYRAGELAGGVRFGSNVLRFRESAVEAFLAAAAATARMQARGSQAGQGAASLPRPLLTGCHSGAGGFGGFSGDERLVAAHRRSPLNK